MRGMLIAGVAVMAMAMEVSGARGENPFEISGRAAADQVMIADFLALDWGKVAKSEGVWVVGEVTLDPESYIPKGRMVPEGGPDAKLVSTVFVKGEWKVLAKLAGDCGKEGWAFEWTPIFHGGASGRRSARRMQPLRNGVWVMRVDEKAEGAGQFPEIYQLPGKEWAGYGREVVEAYQKHGEWWAEAGKNKERLAGLATGENPLLALEAFRALAGAAALDGAMAEKALGKAPWVTQAMMLQVLLGQVKDGDVEAGYAGIGRVIGAATRVEEVEGLVAGATFLPRGGKEAESVGNMICRDIEKRMGELKGAEEVRKGVERMMEIRKLGR